MRKPHSGVYGGMREGGCTEPSKLLSNEPQASSVNLRSGKFPRRPCCFPVFTATWSFPYLLSFPLFFILFLRRKNCRHEGMYTHCRRYCHIPAQLPAFFVRILSQFFFSILSSHFFFLFSLVRFFVRFSRCKRSTVSGLLPARRGDYASSSVRCESRPLTCPGNRMTVRDTYDDVSTRGTRGTRREDRLYRFSFLLVGNFEIARSPKGSRSIKDGRQEAERGMYGLMAG